MAIWNNPVARREWVWAKRQWPLGVAVLLVAVGLSLFLHLFVSRWMFSGGRMSFSWVFQVILSSWLRTPMIVALFLVLAALDRERRSNGWEQLASTRLTIREIIWGKLAVPVGYVFLVSVVLFAVSMAFLMHTMVSIQRSQEMTTWILWASYPLGLIEDFMYAAMVCVVIFRCGWRRTFGHGLLVSVATLLGTGLAIGVVSQVVSGLSQVALSAAGLMQDIGWLFAVQNLAYNIPACTLEGLVAFWFYRRLEAEMRTDLAGGTESRIG